MGTGSFTIRDRSDELTVTRFNTLDIQTASDTATEVVALFNAGVMTGIPVRAALTVQERINVAGPIGSNAQRELKWVVTYEDTTEFLDSPADTVPNPGFGKLYNFEIGTANAAALEPGTDILSPSSPEYAAINNFIGSVSLQSPTGGSASLRRVRLVGRNI